mgnify:FL=1
MRKYILLIAGLFTAPFIGHKDNASDKALKSTVNLANKASKGKSIIEIKPLDKTLIAPQDITDPKGSKGKGGKSKNFV